MSDDAWIVDKIRIGPGLIKKNGVLDVNQFDPRSTDASLVIPVAHGYTHAEGGGDPIPGMLTDADPRLTDARTPTAHAASHADGGSDEVTLAQSQVTGLVSALAALAPLASPVLTGNPTAPTPTFGDADTSVATTAFVAAALAAFLPPYGPTDVAKSLTVTAGGALMWASAGALVPLTYDSIKTYDSASTYDEEFYS